MDVTVLFENTKPEGTGFVIDNGLSVLIEKDGLQVLYDTGRSDGLLKNAAILGVDLGSVDVAVISHGHADHTGGLISFLQANDHAPVYLKKKALIPLLAKTPNKEMNITTDPRIASDYRGRLRFVDTITDLGKGLFIVPEIKRYYPIPFGNRILFAEENGKIVSDSFQHELFMIARNGESLVIFTGCGHLGLQNIVETAKDAFPGVKIESVIGGFHYEAPGIEGVEEPEESVEAAAKWIGQEIDGVVYTGHCTGTRGYSIMKRTLNDRLIRFTTGMKIKC
jgi:7,8-dihydropterin-6-yl-methyl-4-(beta-D-ribofuranosyl)aminobenzene 5'-phosphate synthase